MDWMKGLTGKGALTLRDGKIIGADLNRMLQIAAALTPQQAAAPEGEEQTTEQIDPGAYDAEGERCVRGVAQTVRGRSSAGLDIALAVEGCERTAGTVAMPCVVMANLLPSG